MSNRERDPLGNIEEKITLFFFIIMCISLFLQLFSRFIGKPLVFTEEISRYSYVWIVFIAMSLAIKTNDHIAIDFFKNKLPGRIQKILNVLINFCSVLFFIYLTFYGIQYVTFTKTSLTPALEIPMMVVTVSLPIGFALSAIRSVIRLIQSLKPHIEEV